MKLISIFWQVLHTFDAAKGAERIGEPKKGIILT